MFIFSSLGFEVLLMRKTANSHSCFWSSVC